MCLIFSPVTRAYETWAVIGWVGSFAYCSIHNDLEFTRWMRDASRGELTRCKTLCALRKIIESCADLDLSEKEGVHGWGAPREGRWERVIIEYCAGLVSL